MEKELLKLYVHEFTARKQEVVYWVAQGLSNAEIGQKLYVAPETVAEHLTEIYELLATLPELTTYERVYRPVAIRVFAIFFHEYPELKPLYE